MKRSNTPRGSEKPTTYQILVRVLTVSVTILFAVVVTVPGVLRIIYRADAQVALGNATAVRLALQTAATEAYGLDRPFSDPASESGLTESLEREVYLLASVPGTFMVLRTDSSGYEVTRFLYQENEMQVIYDAVEASYEVSRKTVYIKTKRQH